MPPAPSSRSMTCAAARGGVRWFAPMPTTPFRTFRVSGTRRGLPSSRAPPPRRAVKTSPAVGTAMTPATVSRPSCTAIETHQCGSPLRKGLVPSIGSITQVKPEAAAVAPNSSPRKPSSGKLAATRARISVSTSRSARLTMSWALVLASISSSPRRMKKSSASAPASRAVSSASARRLVTSSLMFAVPCRWRFALRSKGEGPGASPEPVTTTYSMRPPG